jgi:endonuclease YncB( thermonuclease family)
LKSAEPLSQRFLPFCRAWRWPTIFVGQVSVIDGDTAEMHGVRIRLWVIDAPESSQLCRGEDSLQYHCGAQAANELDAFIDRRPINCVPVSLDPYGRTVATCSVAGRDLGEWLVQNGLALDWPNTRRAGITKLSARLSAPARESGRAATSSRGSIVHISAQAENRRLFGRCKCPSLSDPSKAPIHKLRWPVTILGQVALAPFGRLTLPIILNCLTAE